MTYRSYGLMALAILLFPVTAEAHGRAGDRFFPATLAIDDPSVADELTLPMVTTSKDADGVQETEYEGEFSKKITDDFGLSVGGAYSDHGDDHGFENWSVGAKYQAIVNAEHEFIFSAGLDWDIGKSGTNDIGEDHSNLTPEIFFGKGFGDLPDSLDWAKPFALTGVFGVEVPLNSEEDDSLTYGLTLQYSIPYLQQHVKDIGFGAPFNNLVPVVEFAFTTPTGSDSQTTGTINPGIIWTGQTTQLGLEAVIPVNNESGDNVGVRAQLHFYLDDLVPALFGHN